MIICSNCGNGNDDDSRFCRKCGSGLAAPEASYASPQKAATPPQQGPTTVRTAEEGTTSLSPNIARMLCYVAGWISGIVFLIVEKKDLSIRFHAWQSVLAFGVLTLLVILYNAFFIPGVLWSVWWFVRWLFWLVIYIGGLVLWIVFIVKALQGQDYHLPVIGSIAHSLAYKGHEAEEQSYRVQSQTQSHTEAAAQKPVKPSQSSAPLKAAELPAEKRGTKGDSKYCISCGEVLPKKATFCSRCGEKQS